VRLKLRNIVILLGMWGCCSCGVNRYLPPGQKLYDGARVEVIKAPEIKTSAASLKNELAGIATPKNNKWFLGMPYKVWWWYMIGKPKKEDGFKAWYRNVLGDPPVLSQSVDPALNARNMMARLENEGYFNSVVTGDTVVEKNKFKAVYRARIARPYSIRSTGWRLDSSRLAKDIQSLPREESHLKTGKQFNADHIKAEEKRITQLLKEKGYYYFEPEHLLTYIDTNHNNYTAALYMGIKPQIPLRAKTPYKINRITAVTQYFTPQTLPESLQKALPQHEGIHIYDSARIFKPDIFSRAITFRTGSLYSLPEQNKTQTRLNSLGTFKFIRSEFEPAPVGTGDDLMDVSYYMTAAQKRKFQFEIGGFTRSNSYSGGQASIQWEDKNFLRGAESFVVKTTGSFELTPNDSLSENNNWRVGVETSLNVPKLISPIRLGSTFAYFPKTRILLSYDWVRHQDTYTEHYFNFRYELNWSDTVTKEYRFIPFSLTISNSSTFTQTYTSRLASDQKLEYVIPMVITPSLGYHYRVTNSSADKRHGWRMHVGVEVAGTVLGLVKGNGEPFSKKIGDALYSQFVKTDFDYTGSRKLANDVYWVNRLMVGVGFPYGNSAFIPFSRQFLVGGANSLRGFIPRRLGPGSTQATEQQQSTYPQIGGDYKLELNTELRYPLAGYVKGALFVDAGNIWMKDTLLYTSKGQLTKDFIEQIALDAGLGFRLDFTFLVLRLDFALPLYKPYLSSGDRWIFKDFDIGDADWRKENFVVNFAIGYPF
jgi:outer membrane protein insertion porin family